MCFYCGEVLCFNDDLTLRPATYAELVDGGPECMQQLRKMRAQILGLREKEKNQ